MIDIFIVRSVALYEARILLRAWSFRIFSIVGIVFLVFMNIAMATRLGQVPHFVNSLSASLPIMNIKLLNVYQGLIAAFLASEFIKRDRKQDSTEVIYMRSMTNADYILGKTLGILFVFALLNGAVLLIGLFFHLLFSETPFAWQPYVYCMLLMSIPTLVFMTGVSSMLMNLVRSQAVVFVLLLGFSIVSLVYLGDGFFHVFDLFAWYIPATYSDFIGLGNWADLVAVRGAYLMSGIGLIGISILLMKRLPQSTLANGAAAAISVTTIALAVILSVNYIRGGYTARDYREHLRELSGNVENIPVAAADKCSIILNHRGRELDLTAEMEIRNDNAGHLDSLLFTINPGLEVSGVRNGSEDLECRREDHLLWIFPRLPLAPDSSEVITIHASGRIDERMCYLDQSDQRIEETYMLWLSSIRKRYAIVEPDCLLLTPEASWYPVPGLTRAASYPKPAPHDFVEFRLEVETAAGMTAVSQGRVSVDTAGSRLRHRFEPECRLPQLSLAVARFEERSITVDSITYSLFTLPGHDYFEPYFDQVTDTLPDMIRELKNDYEMKIGLEYPYGRLACVEVPIQFYCYDRLWTYAQEMVQPQLVLIPELGTRCVGTDFAGMKRRSKRRQERANLAETAAQVQATYFRSFVRIDLFGIERGMGEPGTELRFHILPNYLSYSAHLYSMGQPVVNYALESYIFNKATPPQDVRWRSWSGITEAEKANLLLRRRSLEDIVVGETDAKITATAMKEKGRFLFALLAATVGVENFDRALTGFLKRYRFQDAPVESFLVAFEDFAELDPAALIESWYSDTVLPGYDIADIESYKVLDGERVRNQIKLTISNLQPADGVVTIGFRSSRQRDALGPWWGGSTGQFDLERTIAIPALSGKEIGVLLDETPAEMAVETYISCNIPSVLSRRFGDLKLGKSALPFDGERLVALDSAHDGNSAEYIVDNEDDGFRIVTAPGESRLRKLLQGLFGSDEEEIPYKGLRFWRPPEVWTPTTDSRFYGRFVQSGVYKAPGDGSQRVSWTMELDQGGMYDVFCYNPNIEMPWMRRGGGGRVMDRGEYTYLVHHDDGIDEVVLDLNMADDGWNLLGTYHISPGTGCVELTDRSTRNIVMADAIKWIRR